MCYEVFFVCEGNELGLGCLMAPGLSEDMVSCMPMRFLNLQIILPKDIPVYQNLNSFVCTSFTKASTNKLCFINQVSYICPYKVLVMILQPNYTEARVKSNGNSDVMNLKSVIMAQWAY